jgi:phosphoribosylglycinamide formyltransferase-1
MSRSYRIGVVLSAGGSSFIDAFKIAAGPQLEFRVVTDRDCEAEVRCKDLSIPVRRFEEPDNRRFSIAAKDYFQAEGIDFVVLFFSRLITEELFGTIACCNVHPALLPAFPGLSAVKKAWRSGVRFLGATVHTVDASVDGGPIIAQTVTPIPIDAELEWCNRASFLQKTLLMLIILDLTLSGRLIMSTEGLRVAPGRDSEHWKSNPSLSNQRLIRGFEALQSGFGMRVFP